MEGYIITKGFWLKINIPKVIYCTSWTDVSIGELSKSSKICLKLCESFKKKIIEKYLFWGTFYVIDIFDDFKSKNPFILYNDA